MSTILNRQVKVIGFWYFRPPLNLLIDDIPNFWECWLPIRPLVDACGEGFAQERFHYGSKNG